MWHDACLRRIPVRSNQPDTIRVRLESLTYIRVRLESLTYVHVRLESLTYNMHAVGVHPTPIACGGPQ